MAEEMSKIKTKLWIIVVVALTLYMLAERFIGFKFLNSNWARIIFWILIAGVLYPAFRPGRKITAWTFRQINEKLLKGIKKKIKQFWRIKRLRSRKFSLLNENKKLFEKDVMYETIPKKLAELETAFFMEEHAEPYKRIKSIDNNIDKINKLNEDLYNTISSFVNFTKEEQDILASTIGFSVENEKGFDNLREFFSKHGDLNKAELARKLKLADEEEVNAFKSIHARNREILQNITKFEQLFSQEKSDLEKLKQITTDITNARKDARLKEKIAKGNVKELQEKINASINTFTQQTNNLNPVFSAIIGEKAKIEAEVEKQIKKSKEEAISKQKFILLSRHAPAGEELRVILKDEEAEEKTAITIKDIMELVKFIGDGNMSERMFEDIMQKPGGRQSKLSRFMHSIGGEKLAGLIEIKVRKKAEEGIEQLQNVLLEYFNLDSYTYALKRFK